jgi:hypothetical protein
MNALVLIISNISLFRSRVVYDFHKIRLFKEMKTCIVTMFFNLSKASDASSATRPLEFYIKHGAPTLSLPHFMVIFCDEETKPLLESMRGDLPTKYIVRSIFDYDHVKALRPIVVKNREARAYDDKRNTVSQFMVTSFKPTAIYLAKLSVEADTYMWVDFGGSHIAQDFLGGVARIIENPRPKITLCYIHYRNTRELYPMSKYLATGGPCGVAATVFTVSADHVDRFYTSMMSVQYEQICEGVGHNEEQMMIYVYDRHPEWFSLYYGDYYSCVTNYHKSVADLDCIHYNFIRNARAADRNDLADEALRSME